MIDNDGSFGGTGEPDGDADEGRFPIVGLGASAGGLRALEAFFANMPSDSGLAFVVITHQHPDQASLLADLLGRMTEMPVAEVSSELAVEPNHIYTAPPGHNLDIDRQVLRAIPGQRFHLPIDHFFRSLARERRDRAIAIVLSGTGGDGSVGLKEIKGELGMVMVQDPASAEYSGMPKSAIATAVVDYVLPTAEMPAQLIAYIESLVPALADPAEDSERMLDEVFALIRKRIGHDFSQYKRSTISRRLERRMSVHHIGSLERYVELLRDDSAELELLFKELLIGVTSFFRDPEAWEALGASLTRLVADKPDDFIVRAWVPGCSTGEEAFSLAVLLHEVTSAQQRNIGVQIFATDLDARAIDIARAGVYPLGVANDISPERLAAFFVRDNDAYRVRQEIRDTVVFATQNLIADPPFTRLDVLSCRNLLIYLEAALQKRLVPLFYYALNPGCLLFLGSSESIGTFGDLFAPVVKKWNIFERKDSGRAIYPTELTTRIERGGQPGPRRGRDTPPSFGRIVERMLLSDLVPPTALIRERGDIVHIHGRTGEFLEPAQGPRETANLFNMARPGLEVSLFAAIRRAATSGGQVVQRGIRVASNGGHVSVDLRIRRLTQPEALAGLFSVSFENVQPIPGDHSLEDDSETAQLDELASQLQHTRESHQGTIDDLETAYEQLKSANEELQSTNEELQSTNEELETSKEELQTLNEELQTVNSELEGKLAELSQANNDMKNLLDGTGIATVFLDSDLRVKRFTEQARHIIRLIPSDVGRPIGDLTSGLHYDQLLADAREVLRTLTFKEVEVAADSGETYLMRILPYRTTENVIDGLVLTFVDVTKLKELRAEQARLLELLDQSPACLVGQDRDGRIVWGFGRLFGDPASQLIGRSDSELFDDDSARALAAVKTEVLASGSARLSRVRLSRNGAPRDFDVYIASRSNQQGDVVGTSAVLMDVTAADNTAR